MEFTDGTQLTGVLQVYMLRTERLNVSRHGVDSSGSKETVASSRSSAEAPHGGSTEPEALDLPQLLGGMAVVKPGVGALEQLGHAGAPSAGSCRRGAGRPRSRCSRPRGPSAAKRTFIR